MQFLAHAAGYQKFTASQRQHLATEDSPQGKVENMGVRFACHACGKRLNVKSELAGRRGICPACSVRFRIPAHDTQTSTPIDASEAPDADGSSAATESSANSSRPQRPKNAPAASASSATTAASRPAAQQSRPQQHDAESRQPSLDEVLGGTSATWYVRPSSGGQFGPADGPTLGQWISEGRVADSAMLWRDGWPEWRIAQNVLQRQKGTEQSRVEPNASPVPAAHSAALVAHSPAPVTHSPGSVTPSPAPVTPSPAPVTPSPAPVTPSPAPVTRTPTLTNVNEASAATVPAADPDAPLRTGGKVLDTNKKRVSRKRVAISVVLALVFVLLLAALIFVLLRT